MLTIDELVLLRDMLRKQLTQRIGTDAEYDLLEKLQQMIDNACSRG